MFDLGALLGLVRVVASVTLPPASEAAPAVPTAGDDGAILLFLVAASVAAIALLVRPEPR